MPVVAPAVAGAWPPPHPRPSRLGRRRRSQGKASIGGVEADSLGDAGAVSLVVAVDLLDRSRDKIIGAFDRGDGGNRPSVLNECYTRTAMHERPVDNYRLIDGFTR